MLLRQFLDKETSTFTYLIAEKAGSPAAIIDPVQGNIALYNQFIKELGLTLVYCLDTHTHADHITASGPLAKQHHAKIVMSEYALAKPIDTSLTDGQILAIGHLNITTLLTPGHTNDSCCFSCSGVIFTGDTLLIRGTGRTDFQSGDPKAQFESITKKLFSYPDHTLIYPGHDYKIVNVSTIGEEKRFNPRLQTKNSDEYVHIMNHLNLTYPKKIDIAVPANLTCGLSKGA